MKECPDCKRCFPDHINHCPDDGNATTRSLPGEPIIDGRYRLVKRLGQGGMGLVFQAQHIFLKTAHAIKVILPDVVGNDPMLVTRFRQEALAAAAIRHQNVIWVTDYGVLNGTMPFLVMELVEGKSLQEILRDEKRLSHERALEFISAIGAGLGAAHRQNIVHYDLKPLNIILKANVPITEGAKILDFGLAKLKSGELLGSFVQAETSGLGSPFYMAPELWSGEELDSRADVYSLGIILYQMLSGDVPFKGPSIPAIMKKHLTLPPPSFKSVGVDVPPQVEAAVFHALEKDVTARTPTVEAFIAELRDAVTSETRLTGSRSSGSFGETLVIKVPSWSPGDQGARERKEEESWGRKESWLDAYERPDSAKEAARVSPSMPSGPHAPSGALPVPRVKEQPPIYLDENVQFTVYRPKKIKPQKWYTLLAYAHLSELRPGEDEVDPIERMELEARKILGEESREDYSRATEDSSQSVPRQGEITFVPFIPGVEFNPPLKSFFWLESVHGQEFRMRASPALDGKTARGYVSVFLGSILLAEINVSLRVESTEVRQDEPVQLIGEKPARPYRKIFPSYSHKDREIVSQIAHYAEVTGDKYMLDIYELRSGQNWKKWMHEAIEDADIFQLFWSTNSMRSQNVKLEWMHALRLERQNFIRPTYWENPLPKSPSDNLPPPELLDLHFYQIRSPLSVSVGGAALPVGEEAKPAEPRAQDKYEPQERATVASEKLELEAAERRRAALEAERVRREEEERFARQQAEREREQREQNERVEQAREMEERLGRLTGMRATGVTRDSEATQMVQGVNTGPLTRQNFPQRTSFPSSSGPAPPPPKRIPVPLIGVVLAVIGLIIGLIVVFLVLAKS